MSTAVEVATCANDLFMGGASVFMIYHREGTSSCITPDTMQRQMQVVPVPPGTEI
jgi:hypothetical protein